nr:PREDICTED: chromosome transmission fidelity protein 18 homolog isoform X1 [Daucus carota subsp. sativus]
MDDMDMDIPDPDELQWLEANSNLHDDLDFDDDFQPPFPDDDDHTPTHTPPIPQSQPPTRTDSNKRPQSPPPIPTIPDNFASEEASRKRSRIEPQVVVDEIPANTSANPAAAVAVDDDEDWLPPPVHQVPQPIEEDEVPEETIVSRYASRIDGDFVPVTGPCGDRVYAKISRFGFDDSTKKNKLHSNEYSNGLIAEPVSLLMQRVEQDAVQKALLESFGPEGDVILPKVPVINEKLWVDKYSPNSFMELLSDEQTNREVLLWLKQWDSCVFGSEIKTTTEDVLSSLRRHTSVAQHQKANKSYIGKNKETWQNKENFREYKMLDQENNDSKGTQDLGNRNRKGYATPEQKILLLCGPPGLGKTTLAHVAARHCGYRVVEINASDDRSSSTIEAKILDVVQMNSIMADSKPKCLVIDEIDGALGDGKGAVDVILKMVSADKKFNTGKEQTHEDQSGKGSSKKKSRDTSLLRPVICICNDLYAPALKSLRQVAKVHVFVQPTVSRIVNRLKYICSKEGMKASSIALTALAEYTECDIRSCLNTLQFLNRKKETLNMIEISSQVVGRKDTSKSFFDIWKEIFQKKRVKQERKASSGCKNVWNEFEYLHSLISNRGDYDLVMDGIHENILKLHYHDPMMKKTVKCMQNLEVSDIVHQYIMRTQKMSLHVYQPAIAISIHGVIAQVEKPNIEWPKSFQRFRTTLMEKVDLLHLWHHNITPYISRHLTIKSFVEDSISLLLHILSPPTLRPVALHLLSEKEKKDLVQLVNTMVSYSVTYKSIKPNLLSSNLRHEVGVDASVLSFDPPLVDLIRFKDYTSSHFVLALAMKQVLLHEVEKQKILQAGINRSVHLTDVCKENKNLAMDKNGINRSTHLTDVCKKNQTMEMDKNGRIQSSRSHSVSVKKAVDVLNPSEARQCEKAAPPVSSNLSSSVNSSVAIKLSSTVSTKKPSRGNFNFFERFKKVSSEGSQATDTVQRRPATSERDSRPFLFKFNEAEAPIRITLKVDVDGILLWESGSRGIGMNICLRASLTEVLKVVLYAGPALHQSKVSSGLGPNKKGPPNI